MIEQKVIVAKIQEGLKNCSEKHQISGKDIQLLISNGRKIQIVLMSGNEIVVKNEKPVLVDICELFKVSALENMIAVTPYLKNILSSFAKKKGIDEGAVNIAVFTKQEDFYPSVKLQNYNEVVAELTINDFLN